MRQARQYPYHRIFIGVMILGIIVSNVWAEEAPAIQKARSFLLEVMDISGTSFEVRDKGPALAIGLPYVKVRVDRNYSMLVAEDGAQVYEFSVMKPSQDGNLIEKTRADAISAETAFSALERIVSYYGLPKDIKQYQATLMDTGTAGKVEDDLWGCSWDFRKEFELDGVPCRMREFGCLVSASSGKVSLLMYWPVIPPQNSPDRKVSEETARAVVNAWFGGQRYFQEARPAVDDYAESASVVIAPEINMFMFSEHPAWDNVKAYYAWEIPIHWTERSNQFPGVVWVNVEDGTVVGATSGRPK